MLSQINENTIIEDNKQPIQENKKPIEAKKNIAKEELITKIRDWIKLDNDLIKLKTEIKEKTENKKILTQTLVELMKSHSIDCFDINGGALVYKQRKTRKTISKKFLLEQLEMHFNDQPDLAKEITQKLLDNRQVVIKDDLTRKISKKDK